MDRSGMAECHETDPMLMIDPPPAFFMPGTTHCAAKNWCRRFTARRWSQYAGVTSSNRWRSSFAALFTSTDTGPDCFSISAKFARNESTLVRSHGRNRTPFRSEEHTSELQSQFHLV